METPLCVQVCGGVVDMAVGGDQGGSVRIPASFTGIVGLKPTWGLVPYTGASSIEPTVDHLGPMAKTVTDCSLLLEVLIHSFFCLPPFMLVFVVGSFLVGTGVLVCVLGERKMFTAIARLHIGHSFITHSFLLKSEEPPMCIG